MTQTSGDMIIWFSDKKLTSKWCLTAHWLDQAMALIDAVSQCPIFPDAWLAMICHESQIVCAVSWLPCISMTRKKATMLGNKARKDKTKDCTDPLLLYWLKNSKNNTGKVKNAKTSWLNMINTDKALISKSFMIADKSFLLYNQRIGIKKQKNR